MKQQAETTYYPSFWMLYKDQKEALKAQLRGFWHSLGYKGGSINRKLKEGEEKRTIQDLKLLNEAFGICYDPKKGYFFDNTIAKNEIYGLS